jgi:hypothetical protein
LLTLRTMRPFMGMRDDVSRNATQLAGRTDSDVSSAHMAGAWWRRRWVWPTATCTTGVSSTLALCRHAHRSPVGMEGYIG